MNIDQIPPHQAPGAKVEFVINGLAEPLAFNGTIKNAASRIELDGKYQVWFEIENRQAVDNRGNTQWILRPGMSGTMSITIANTQPAPNTEPAEEPVAAND